MDGWIDGSMDGWMDGGTMTYIMSNGFFYIRVLENRGYFFRNEATWAACSSSDYSWPRRLFPRRQQETTRKNICYTELGGERL